MIPTAMVEEMRAGALARYRAKVAAMTDAEVIAAHDAECATVEAAILAGAELPPHGWHLDRVAALQEERARRLAPPPIVRHVPWVQITHEDGHRLRYPIRCF